MSAYNKLYNNIRSMVIDMRCYHYGYMLKNEPEVKKADTFRAEKEQVVKDGLVIDEDTVYEIDEECINCRKKMKI